MRTTQSPCATDALSATRMITVNGRTAGIARLCDAVADVRMPWLTRDDALRTALVSRVRQDNCIPEKLIGPYAGALPAEYRATAGKAQDGEDEHD